MYSYCIPIVLQFTALTFSQNYSSSADNYWVRVFPALYNTAYVIVKPGFHANRLYVFKWYKSKDGSF